MSFGKLGITKLILARDINVQNRNVVGGGKTMKNKYDLRYKCKYLKGTNTCSLLHEDCDVVDYAQKDCGVKKFKEKK